MFCSVFTASCTSPTANPTSCYRTAIFGGQRDDRHAAVGSVMVRGTLRCSATLVGARSVLTASHCLRDTRADEIRVALSAVQWPVRRAHVHPEWNPEVSPFVNDIAVLMLAGEPFVPSLSVSDRPPTEGLTVRIVGYGAAEVDRSVNPPEPREGTNGSRHAATAQVQTVADSFFSLRNAPANVAEGDSGGPVLSQVAGHDVLFGVISTSSRDYVTSHHVRLDVHVPWLTDVTAGDLRLASGVSRLTDGSVFPCDTEDGS